MPPEPPPDAADNGTGEETTEELRRIAFGPASTEEARAAATRQLARRQADAVAATDGPTPAGSAPTDRMHREDLAITHLEEREGQHGRRSIALVWLLPIVIVSLAAGAIAGRALGPAPSSPRTPAAASDTASGRHVVRGNVDAARAQLAGTRSGAEHFPDPGFVDNLGLESVTLIGDLHYNDLHITVWGATNRSDDLCLIAGVPDGTFSSQCVTAKEFGDGGITLGFNGFEVSWDGVSYSAVPLTSGPDASPDSPTTQKTVPVVGQDTNSPVGNLRAARELFATAPAEQPRYPFPTLLGDIRQSTVRYLGGDQELVRAWAAEDGNGEICLLLDQNGTGAVRCSTVPVFVSHGIALGVGEYSASWNGRDWASSSPSGYRQGISTPAAG